MEIMQKKKVMKKTKKNAPVKINQSNKMSKKQTSNALTGFHKLYHGVFRLIKAFEFFS